MNTERDHSLDADERELARVLRALPASEPSAALDTRILAMGRDAVVTAPQLTDEAQPRRRPRWLWGTGVAASCVLAAGLAWRLGGLDDDALDRFGAAAPQDAAAETVAAEPEALPILPPPGAPALPRAVPQRAEAQTAEAPAGAAREQRSAPPPAAAFVPEPPAALFLPEPPATAFAPDPAAAAGHSAVLDAAETGSRLREADVALDADASVGEQDWLEQIRWLIKQGDDAGARASLQRFEQKFPGAPLPADLADFRNDPER